MAQKRHITGCNALIISAYTFTTRGDTLSISATRSLSVQHHHHRRQHPQYQRNTVPNGGDTLTVGGANLHYRAQ
jgi:hypothetical protein